MNSANSSIRVFSSLSVGGSVFCLCDSRNFSLRSGNLLERKKNIRPRNTPNTRNKDKQIRPFSVNSVYSVVPSLFSLRFGRARSFRDQVELRSLSAAPRNYQCVHTASVAVSFSTLSESDGLSSRSPDTPVVRSQAANSSVAVPVHPASGMKRTRSRLLNSRLADDTSPMACQVRPPSVVNSQVPFPDMPVTANPFSARGSSSVIRFKIPASGRLTGRVLPAMERNIGSSPATKVGE